VYSTYIPRSVPIGYVPPYIQVSFRFLDSDKKIGNVNLYIHSISPIPKHMNQRRVSPSTNIHSANTQATGIEKSGKRFGVSGEAL